LTKPDENSPQYRDWLEYQTFVEVDESSLKKQLKADLAFAKSLTQKDYTLWKTWEQIQTEFDKEDEETLKRIKRVKRKIWKPKSPNDVLDIEPEIVLTKHEFPIKSVSIWGNTRTDFHANPDPIHDDWTILRHFASSMQFGGNMGQQLRFIVRDKNSKKYLGLLCLTGGSMDLKGRDAAVGWTNKHKNDQKKLKHIANGSVVVSTQPFGFYVGGKLLSLLLASKRVIETWEQVYDTKLVGIETTALYGEQVRLTQYDNLRHWKKYGYTTGSTSLEPQRDTDSKLRNWMQSKYPFEYWRLFKAKRESGQTLIRDHRNRARQFCYRKLGFEVKDFQSNHKRGIYFCGLYKNAFDFLRGEIEEGDLEPGFDNSTKAMVELWREKYAVKRVKDLIKSGRVKNEIEFLDELLFLGRDEIEARLLA